jgi:hypothetical protein
VSEVLALGLGFGVAAHQCLEERGRNANDFIAPAVLGVAALPPSSDIEADRERMTRQHLQNTHANESKQREPQVVASVGETLQAQMAANHAEVMAQFDAIMAQFDRQNAMIARNGSNARVRQRVSKSQYPLIADIFRLWFLFARAQRNNNGQMRDWHPLMVENVYIAPPVGNANLAPPLPGSVPPNQPANAIAVGAMDDVAITALGRCFNTVFAAGDALEARKAAVVEFYTTVD